MSFLLISISQSQSGFLLERSSPPQLMDRLAAGTADDVSYSAFRGDTEQKSPGLLQHQETQEQILHCLFHWLISVQSKNASSFTKLSTHCKQYIRSTVSCEWSIKDYFRTVQSLLHRSYYINIYERKKCIQTATHTLLCGRDRWAWSGCMGLTRDQKLSSQTGRHAKTRANPWCFPASGWLLPFQNQPKLMWFKKAKSLYSLWFHLMLWKYILFGH